MTDANVISSGRYNRDAERAVLGSMLRLNSVIDEVATDLQAQDFYAPYHGLIFESMLWLRDHNQPVDLVTSASRLQEVGHIEDIGGPGYLSELWDCSPTAAHALHYARLVKEASLLRQFGLLGMRMADDSQNQSAPVSELLDKADQELFRLAMDGTRQQGKPLADAVGEAFDRIDASATRDAQFDGVPTGLSDLDLLLSGLRNSEFVVIGARPSLGKTALATTIALHAASCAMPVLFISLEQPAVVLAQRLMAAQAGVNLHKIRLGLLNTQEIEKLREAASVLRQLPVFINDNCGQNMMQISSLARRFRLSKKLRLLVVDYLTLVEPAPGKEPRHEKIAAVARRLQYLARELAIPVLALAQLNRNVEGRQGGRPRLADLRESGEIEAAADTVMFLHSEEESDDKQPCRIIDLLVAKQRNGPTGEVSLIFRKAFARFENYHPGV